MKAECVVLELFSNLPEIASINAHSGPIRVTLAESDGVSSRLMRSVLQLEPDITLDQIDQTALLASIQRRRPDIVILDIHTPAIRHAESWESLGVTPPAATIFTTYDASTASQFAVHATDLLEKPFNADSFRNALLRAKLRIVRQRLVPQFRVSGVSRPQLHQYLQRLPVEANEKIVLLRAGDIEWLQSSGNQVRVHVGTRSHLIRRSLTKLQDLLDPIHFLRVHRNAIVNLDHVEEFHLPTLGNMFVKLRSGFCLPLRKSSRAQLRRALMTTHHSVSE